MKPNTNHFTERPIKSGILFQSLSTLDTLQLCNIIHIANHDENLEIIRKWSFLKHISCQCSDIQHLNIDKGSELLKGVERGIWLQYKRCHPCSSWRWPPLSDVWLPPADPLHLWWSPLALGSTSPRNKKDMTQLTMENLKFNWGSLVLHLAKMFK